MKRNTWFNLLMILGLVLALGGSASMARRALAQVPGPEGQSSIQATVDDAFTYQGRLLNSDTPVNGTCDFEFSLWTDFLTGNQVGSTQTKTNVDVDDGYFSAPLDFGGSAFQGDARYLQIAVRCPAGSGSYTALGGRVALTAAPYAHSLRPGAVIEGNVSLGAVVKAENTYSGILINYGLHGVAQATGVLGTGGYTGVKGETASTTGRGVYGEATAASGANYGVYGKSNSASGHGVYGTVAANNPLYAGVTGANTGTGTGSGVYGFSIAGYGVYGRSTGNKAIYSDGDAHVEGDLTWKAKTSYVSVAATAFHPMVDGYDYNNQGHTLWNNDGSSNYYAAPVQLPHGATVTKLTFYWWDGSLVEGHCTLYRTNMTSSEVVMAEAWTSGDAATSDSSQDDTIVYATVDNSQYSYYLYWELPDMVVAGHGVVIEYTFTEPY